LNHIEDVEEDEGERVRELLNEGGQTPYYIDPEKLKEYSVVNSPYIGGTPHIQGRFTPVTDGLTPQTPA